MKFRNNIGEYILILSILLIFAGKAEAACKSQVIKKCRRMKLISTEIKTERDFLYPSPRCEVHFEDTASKKNWIAVSAVCPKMGNPQLVYIDFGCLDMPGASDDHFDQIEIWTGKSCGLPVINQLLKLDGPLNRIKKGDSLRKLESLGLKKVDVLGNIWRYHSFPGISVDVEVMYPKCPKSGCRPHDAVISQIVRTYEDFLLFDSAGNWYYSSATGNKFKVLK